MRKASKKEMAEKKKKGGKLQTERDTQRQRHRHSERSEMMSITNLSTLRGIILLRNEKTRLCQRTICNTLGHHFKE